MLLCALGCASLPLFAAVLAIGRPLTLLRCEGTRVNHKKLRRLYREERLQVRRRGGRKRALGTRAPLALPQGPNQRWSLDFLSGTLTDSRRFRIPAVGDFTTSVSRWLPIRPCQACGSVANSTQSSPGAAGHYRSSATNGTELTSMAILERSQGRSGSSTDDSTAALVPSTIDLQKYQDQHCD
jgi:putative transposase